MACALLPLKCSPFAIYLILHVVQSLLAAGLIFHLKWKPTGLGWSNTDCSLPILMFDNITRGRDPRTVLIPICVSDSTAPGTLRPKIQWFSGGRWMILSIRRCRLRSPPAHSLTPHRELNLSGWRKLSSVVCVLEALKASFHKFVAVAECSVSASLVCSQSSEMRHINCAYWGFTTMFLAEAWNLKERKQKLYLLFSLLRRNKKGQFICLSSLNFLMNLGWIWADACQSRP